VDEVFDIQIVKREKLSGFSFCRIQLTQNYQQLKKPLGFFKFTAREPVECAERAKQKTTRYAGGVSRFDQKQV
jgi:hypothetical protein